MLKSDPSASISPSFPTQYDGYTSCPLITSMDKAILAEFDFNVMPLETFPIDQGPPRRWVYRLKKDFMPGLYWHMLLRSVSFTLTFTVNPEMLACH